MAESAAGLGFFCFEETGVLGTSIEYEKFSRDRKG